MTKIFISFRTHSLYSPLHQFFVHNEMYLKYSGKKLGLQIWWSFRKFDRLTCRNYRTLRFKTSRKLLTLCHIGSFFVNFTWMDFEKRRTIWWKNKGANQTRSSMEYPRERFCGKFCFSYIKRAYCWMEIKRSYQLCRWYEEKLREKTEEALFMVKEWFEDNKLTINMEKT